MNDIITREEVVALLTQDAYYRKTMNWPLLTLTGNEFLFKPVVNRTTAQNILCIRAKYFGGAKMSLVDPRTTIGVRHAFTTDLLVRFKGHLVACGGAITKAVTKFEDANEDIDFFFYDLDIDQATQLRIDVITFLINKWQSRIGSEHQDYGDIIDDIDFYVLRNEYVTTLYVYEIVEGGRDTHVYQFIHRIYPDISSILGGFDISASMVAFDGQEIYATPLGTWSLLNGSIIIDTKRRSTSYETRLRKYHRYAFKLIFPGLTSQIIQDLLINPRKNNFGELMNKITQLIHDYGYEIDEDRDYKIASSIREPENHLVNKSYEIQKKANILPSLFLRNGNQLSTQSYNREIIEDRFINKASDYSDNHMWSPCFPHANATRLRLDNLNSVVSILHLGTNDVNIVNKLLAYDINHPNIEVNDNSITYFTERVDKVREYINDDCYCSLLKCFGKLTPEVFEIIDTPQYYDYRDLMIEKMISNAKICEDKLRGIKWITTNPGRQWTSSINPVFADPREWYGKHYVPVLTGIPESIETCLRLMRLPHVESQFSTLPTDIFNIILMYVCKNYANDAWTYI